MPTLLDTLPPDESGGGGPGGGPMLSLGLSGGGACDSRLEPCGGAADECEGGTSGALGGGSLAPVPLGGVAGGPLAPTGVGGVTLIWSLFAFLSSRSKAACSCPCTEARKPS